MVAGSCINIIEGCFGYRKNGQDHPVLKNINLELHEGDFIGVVGLNGSGKSTLLRSMSGLLPVLNGNIFINQKPLAEFTNNELSKQVSIVLTEKIGGFNLTAFDAVAAGQLPYTNLFNRLEAHHLEIINHAINICGLRNHHNKLLSELSDGLFQKTMIAKCLAQQAPIMLLDEPSAYLDYGSKHELFKLLKTFSEENKKCILLSSHDLNFLLKYCNKILLIQEGNAHLINAEAAIGNPVFTELSGGYL